MLSPKHSGATCNAITAQLLSTTAAFLFCAVLTTDRTFYFVSQDVVTLQGEVQNAKYSQKLSRSHCIM